MALKSLVGGIWLDKQSVVFRPAELYELIGSPYTIFTITGGPVWIVAIFGQIIGPAGITLGDFQISISGVPICATTVCLGIQNDLILVPLDEAAALPMIPGVTAGNYPDPAAGAAFSNKVIAAPGDIDLIVAVDAEDTVAWYCVYYRMSPASLIS